MLSEGITFSFNNSCCFLSNAYFQARIIAKCYNLFGLAENKIERLGFTYGHFWQSIHKNFLQVSQACRWMSKETILDTSFLTF